MPGRTINEVAIIIENHIANETERHNTFDEKLDKLDARLAYTNGNIKDLTIWKSYLIGGMSVLTCLVIPLLIYVWQISQR